MFFSSFVRSFVAHFEMAARPSTAAAAAEAKVKLVKHTLRQWQQRNDWIDSCARTTLLVEFCLRRQRLDQHKLPFTSHWLAFRVRLRVRLYFFLSSDLTCVAHDGDGNHDQFKVKNILSSLCSVTLAVCCTHFKHVRSPKNDTHGHTRRAYGTTHTHPKIEEIEEWETEKKQLRGTQYGDR